MGPPKPKPHFDLRAQPCISDVCALKYLESKWIKAIGKYRGGGSAVLPWALRPHNTVVKSLGFGADIVILFPMTYTSVIPSKCLTGLSLVKAEHVSMGPGPGTPQTLLSSVGEAALDCTARRGGGLGEQAGATHHPSGGCQGSSWSNHTGEGQSQEKLGVQNYVLHSQEAEAGCRSLASRTLPTHHHLQINAPSSTRVPLSVTALSQGDRGLGRSAFKQPVSAANSNQRAFAQPLLWA